MAARFVVLVAALSACQAVPVWIGHFPQAYFRDARSPSVAFGFGSGFSSNIGGISHSTGYGTSFQTGDAEAYGAGIASNDGHSFARGVGIAKSHQNYPTSYQYTRHQQGNHQQPSHQQLGYQQIPINNFNTGFGRNNYGATFSSAQNFGNSGSAISSAHSLNGFGIATSSAFNNGLARYQSAVSSAQNLRGLGYGSAVASAVSSGLGNGSAISAVRSYGNDESALSSARTSDGYNDFESSVAAAENFGNYKASTAQTVQQRGGVLRHSGATSVNAPGIQAANSHAINTGYY